MPSILFHRRLAVAWALALNLFSAHAFAPRRSFRTAKGSTATKNVRLCSSLAENDITQGFAELSEEAPFSLQDRVLEVRYLPAPHPSPPALGVGGFCSML
jgi:hypothetical protein